MSHLIDSEQFGRRRAAAHASGGSGGSRMDDILRKLAAVETAVSDIRSQVSAILAVLTHMATKSELNGLRSDLHAMEASLIKWIVGTSIASVAVASAIASVIAKLVA